MESAECERKNSKAKAMLREIEPYLEAEGDDWFSFHPSMAGELGDNFSFLLGVGSILDLETGRLRLSPLAQEYVRGLMTA